MGLKAFELLEEYLVEHYPSRAERLADGWVHAIGLVAAIAGGIVLLTYSILAGGAGLIAATSLYAVCLVAMLSASTAYNLTHITHVRPVLRRLDEAAIFLMIAGSYTPFTTQRLEGAWAIAMTLLVWLLAVVGVTGKLIAPRISDRAWTLLYVAFGWVAVIAIWPLIHGVTMSALILLVIGGLIYTTGALIFLKVGLPFRRAIWHGFVISAAAIHYAAIFVGVAVAASH
ncbi:MAG: hemolysin III family protein [Alphaproteobacteria bacterium]